MRQIFKHSTQLALTSVLSLALAATVCLETAQAQNSGTQSQSSGRQSRNSGARSRTNRDYDRTSAMPDNDNDERVLPAPMGYPMASPGSLDLYHWTDYTRMHIREGSATEAMLDRRTGRRGDHDTSMGSTEDPEDLMPTTPMYPRVSPGAIDMYHWTDYTRRHLKEGSATEARMDNMRNRDRNATTASMRDEDENELLPIAPSYPWAAPGTLDLNHWTDLTATHMRPGSAYESRMDRMKKKDKPTQTP